ncbi:MAG: hypothetical protein HMLIMOIP_002700 [Candidatus Nitrosomirales archaeon]|jgi:hypothetical protein
MKYQYRVVIDHGDRVEIAGMGWVEGEARFQKKQILEQEPGDVRVERRPVGEWEVVYDD